jgi:hypothetical protein
VEAGIMRYLTDLPIADLRAAGDATETLIEFCDYLSPDGMLVMLAGKFRDDIREILQVKRLERAYRGTEVKPLSDLSNEQYNRLALAVGVLVGRYTLWMDDPELVAFLHGLHELLRVETARRVQPREEVGALWTAVRPRTCEESCAGCVRTPMLKSRTTQRAHITLTGHEKGDSMSGLHSGVNTYTSMSDDGPLMRFLVNGRL